MRTYDSPPTRVYAHEVRLDEEARWKDSVTRGSSMKIPNLSHRFTRIVCAGITTLVFAVAVPVVIGFFMVMLSGWLWSTHAVDNVHMTVWGWLTDLQEQTRTVGKGKHATHVHYLAKKPNMIPLSYEIFVWTAFFLYLLGEGVSWVVGLYAQLSRSGEPSKGGF